MAEAATTAKLANVAALSTMAVLSTMAMILAAATKGKRRSPSRPYNGPRLHPFSGANPDSFCLGARSPARCAMPFRKGASRNGETCLRRACSGASRGARTHSRAISTSKWQHKCRGAPLEQFRSRIAGTGRGAALAPHLEDAENKLALLEAGTSAKRRMPSSRPSSMGVRSQCSDWKARMQIIAAYFRI